MNIPTAMSELDKLRREMGAPLSSWGTRIKEREKFEVDLDPEDFGKTKPIVDGGPLAYQGQQILLYIKHTRRDLELIERNPEGSPRFHISECKTIEEMRKAGRFERYVATNLTDINVNGFFNVTAIDNDSGKTVAIQARLYVCKNCLRSLELFHDLSGWPDFSLLNFFRDHERLFHSLPEHTDWTAPPDGYTKHWNLVAARYKGRVGWKCEECDVNLANDRDLLQCHHKNGVISNDRPENLQALCVECHTRQPWHGWFPPSDEERIRLDRLRAAQGV